MTYCLGILRVTCHILFILCFSPYIHNEAANIIFDVCIYICW